MGNAAFQCIGRPQNGSEDLQQGKNGRDHTSKKGKRVGSENPTPKSLQQSEKGQKSVHFSTALKSMQILPPAKDGVMRVKLIISTNQMETLLSSECGKDFFENLITSLLKENVMNKKKRSAAEKGWKPALQSIPEGRKEN